VVLPGGVRPAAVHVADGRIAAVTEPDALPAATPVLEAGDLVVLPGLVDAHVHVNEPGRADWEGFETATRAAAAGGTTTIVDMPLNSIPPTVTVDALEAKREAARGRCHVDVGFWGGLVPGAEPDLADLVAAGVCGFKAFLIDSGVEEFPPVDAEVLERALPALAGLGRPLLVHAELAEPMAAAQATFAGLAPTRRRPYRAYLSSRPAAGEARAIELLVGLAAATGAHVHVVHVASAEAVEALRRSPSGAAVTAETCPHYLTLTASDVPDGATAFKCAPPIRDDTDRRALWAGLDDGVLAMIVSDHSPAPAGIKALDTGDFGTAWGGISSLQLRLALTWTEVRRRGDGEAVWPRLARWLAAEPARLAGLDDRKGAIEPGRHADVVLFDPETSTTVDPYALEHRHPVSPYAGRRLYGRVAATLLRGRVVYRDGEHVEPAAGALLERG
jgi:allantoinase